MRTISIIRIYVLFITENPATMQTKDSCERNVDFTTSRILISLKVPANMLLTSQTRALIVEKKNKKEVSVQVS